MDFKLKIEKKNNEEEIIFKDDQIIKANFKFNSPDDSESKSSKVSAELQITGKISEDTFGETHKLVNWAVLMSSDKNVYRKVNFMSFSDDKVVRDYTFTNAFIVDYEEDYPESGDGHFVLFIKQRRDRFKEIKIEGNYDKPEEE